MAEDDACVEVLYATAAEQRLVRVPFAAGLTAREAVERSGLVQAFPEIAERELVLGIFGVPAAPGRRLAPGERVEICRPLERDPREARRELARAGKTMAGEF